MIEIKKDEYFKESLHEREREVYFLRDIDDIEKISAEKLVLKLKPNGFNYHTHYDIGAICYLRRERLAKDYNKITGGIHRVDYNSYLPSRKELVLSIIDSFMVSGNEQASILDKWSNYQKFIDWADLNDHCSFHASSRFAMEAYKGYTDFLTHKILVDKTISARTASTHQNGAYELLDLLFPYDSNNIRQSTTNITGQNKEIDAPTKEDVRQYIDTIYALASQLSTSLINSKPFPLLLKFKDYNTYVFHSSGKSILTPYFKEPYLVYNFHYGRINTIEEYKAKIGTNKIHAKDYIESSNQSLNAVNSDPKHRMRIRWANMAIRCYASLLQIITGFNPSQFVYIEYKEALEIIKSPIKRDFKSIKLRAKGRMIRLPIGGKKGIKILKEYLVFREWMLGEASTKFLFFNSLTKSQKDIAPKMLSIDFQSTLFREQLKGKFLPDDFNNITPSLARKFKSIVLYQLGVTPKTVADTLGHAQKTNIKSYSSIDIDSQKEEFENFWRAVEKANASIKERKIKTTEIASGSCENFNNPSKISSSLPIKISCETQYGCLYCKYYICHADREDIHKILSLIYVMEQLIEQVIDIEHSENLFKNICIRANYIIDKISSLSGEHKDDVDDLKYSVNSLGILTSFWEMRLTRYESIGILV